MLNRTEQKILKCLEEYYGGELDLDDSFELICSSDLEITELISRLEVCYEHRLVYNEVPKVHEFEYVKDWIEWVVNHLEK